MFVRQTNKRKQPTDPKTFHPAVLRATQINLVAYTEQCLLDANTAIDIITNEYFQQTVIYRRSDQLRLAGHLLTGPAKKQKLKKIVPSRFPKKSDVRKRILDTSVCRAALSLLRLIIEIILS